MVEFGVGAKKRGVWRPGRLDNRPPEMRENVALTKAPPGKIHVETFLNSTNVPIWHRGGKRAFAYSKNMPYATEAEFETLFKSY